MKCIHAIPLLITLFFATGCSIRKDYTVISPEVWLRQAALEQASKLSPAEKASQVLMAGIDGKDRFYDGMYDHFRGVVPGSILLFGYNIADTPEKTAAYIASCRRALDSMESSVPVLFAIDHEGGDVFRTAGITARLPSASFVASRFSPADAESFYRFSGNQIAALGIDMNLAPVAETETSFNRDFLGTRAYSPDARIVTSFAGAAVRGYRAANVLTVLKHFPGNGVGDPHTGLPKLDISIDALRSIYEATFRALIAEKPDAILVSHIVVPSVDSVPFCLSRKGVTGILREGLGFDGVILTDDISMAAIRGNGWSSQKADVAALEAGCDMVMTSDRDIRSVAAAIAAEAAANPSFAARLDDAVCRIALMKARIGLVKTPLRRYYESRSGGSPFDSTTFYGERRKAAALLEKIHGK
jgi:beta-N-acetylhexosaminidase